MKEELRIGVIRCGGTWRNYTIIGTEGRIENFNDNPGEYVVRLWNNRKRYNPYGDQQYFIETETGGHGGADLRIVDEFIRWVIQGGKIATSSIAARNSVAAGCQATTSLRNGSIAQIIPDIPAEIIDYFNQDEV